MDVSIIIVNYNTEKLISKCIKSIYEKTQGISFEIIVVDNASPIPPNTLKKSNKIIFIQSKINLGFGKANNLGVQHATGDYIFCLNPDTILINNAIKELFDFMQKNSYVGICGSNLYQQDLTPGHSYEMLEPSIIQETLSLRGSTSKRFNEDFNSSATPKKVSHVVGAALMIPRKLFNEVGGFDKDIFMYMEETLLCHLVKKKGYVIYNVPQSKIIHLEGKSFQIKRHNLETYLSGRKIYFTKRYHSIYYILCHTIYITNIGLNIIYSLITKNKQQLTKWKEYFSIAIKHF